MMTEKLKIFFTWVKNVWFRPLIVQPIQDITPKGETPKRKYDKQKSKTLSDLLDELEYTFDAMEIDYDRLSYLSKSDVKGLKKYGVSVIPELVNKSDKDVTKSNIDDGAELPSILFMAINDGESASDKKKFMQPDFFFAIKQKKCPWFVAKQAGVIYNCGFGYRDAYDKDKKILWVNFYITVNKSREVQCTHYLSNKTVQTPTGTYNKKSWVVYNWGRDDLEKDYASKIVAHYFNTWIGKRTMWSTTVQRGEHRAVFYVDPRETKAYFKGRDKSVTENGSTKRIIHLVEEHERKYLNGRVAVVREHIRGLNKFSWKGFDCYVASPKFHLDIQTFTAPSEDVAEEDVGVGKRYVDTSTFADMLHQHGGRKRNEVQETA
jgi:hypothetical protein